MMRVNTRRFFFTIVLPTLLSIGLFILLIFRFIIPYFEQNMINQKKETIRELISSAISVADSLYQKAQRGQIDPSEAQSSAIEQIRSIRYGIENKDYCWITDQTPTMISHPYRPDLNGSDLRTVTDPAGKRLFVEMVRVVNQAGSGYIDYSWQWMDDTDRIVPKISYVKAFKPWSWIIGTGIYIEDIREEISGIKKRLTWVLLLITAAMATLLTFIARQNLRAEMKRSEAEADLLASREKYKTLVDASTEGTWMILEGQTLYTNSQFDDILPDIASQPLSDDFQELIAPERREDLETIRSFIRSQETYLHIETRIVPKESAPVSILMSISKIVMTERKGYIVIIKPLSVRTRPAGEEGLIWADIFEIGYFQASPGKRGTLLRFNEQTRKLLGYDSESKLSGLPISDLVADRRQWFSLLRALDQDGSACRLPLSLHTEERSTRTLLVTARIVRDAQKGILNTEGFLEPQSKQVEHEQAQSALLGSYHSSLLTLLQPVSGVMREPTRCTLSLPLIEALKLMEAHSSDHLIATTEEGTPVGIVSDLELRKGFLERGGDLASPIGRIMRSPIPTVAQDLSLIEAWQRFDERDHHHLLVVDQNDRPVGTLAKETFHRLYHHSLEPLYPSPIKRIDQLKKKHASQREMIRLFSESHCRSEWPNRLMTMTTEQVIRSTMQMIEKEMGPAPVPFALMVLGSLGRSEPTLTSDQDNALIFADPPSALSEPCHRYFGELGSRLNRVLAECGYPLCPGMIMAGNPRWCQPISVWKRYYEGWISEPDQQSLIEATTFFDLRSVYGNPGWITQLQSFVLQSVKQHPAFFNFLARECLQYKIPLGLFGKIQTDATTPHGNRVNIKNPLRVLVNLIRLYALSHEIAEQNSLKRLELLNEKGVIAPSFHNSLKQGFDFLMGLQLRDQLDSRSTLPTEGNSVDLNEMSEGERQALKAYFVDISTLQGKVKHDFSIVE